MSKNKKKFKLVIDLDGTLCSQEKSGTYHLAKPKMDVIHKVNSLWTDGWSVTIHTARGMETCEGDIRKIEETYRKMTEEWLKENRVCYDELVFGKPSGTYYVDDKNLTIEWFLRKHTDQLEK